MQIQWIEQFNRIKVVGLHPDDNVAVVWVARLMVDANPYPGA